jgi:hypothetical protein
MERASHKMEELIKKQKKLLEQSQASTKLRSTRDRSQYLIAFGGVAAGLTIAVIVWLANSVLATSRLNTSTSERAVAIQSGEIAQLNDNIAQLNERVDSLTQSVSNIKAKLIHFMERAESLSNIEAQHADSSTQRDSGSAASTAVNASTETIKAFTPSHVVNARVNLRPSASLKTTPIAVLNVGTEVEYISKSDGWYYVDTQSHGKGWCSSDHLSPLSSTDRKSAAK